MDEIRHAGDGMETPVYSLEDNTKNKHLDGFSNMAYVDHSDTDTHAQTHQTEQDPEEDKARGEFRSLVPFCILYGLGSLFSSSLTTFLSSQITVIERSFGLSSTKSGILLAANDVGFVATVLFASHFLKNSHIPRLLAFCVLTFGVAGLLTSVPHFIADEKMPTHRMAQQNSTEDKNNHLLCYPNFQSNDNGTNCESKNLSNGNGGTGENDKGMVALVIISVLMFIQGVAKAPRQSLSSVFIDNNSERTKTGFYIGLLSSFSIFGPFIAILVGGLLNKIPVDLKETKLQVNDQRWIGAWWLGFVIFGACALIASIPIFCFPASMKKRKAQEDKPTEYVNSAVATKTENTDGQSQSLCYLVKDVPKSVLRVFSTPVYVCNLLSLIMTMLAIMVLGSFGPKYIENQFHIPTYKANIVLGLEKLGTTVLGTFIGGVITRRLRLGLLGCVKMLFVSRIISSVSNCFLIFLGCDRPDIVGYDTQSAYSANLSCDCSNADYLPVCGDGQTFFSPCHAGCLTELSMGYSNCSSSVSGTVVPGLCDTDCNMLIPFVVVNGLSSLIGTAGIAPSFVIMLRSIQQKDRAMAVGLQSFILSLLVFLPAPIVLGKVFDSLCLIWKETCGGKGSCLLYDNTEMRVQLISIDIGLKVAALLFTICAFIFAKRALAKTSSNEKDYELEVRSPKPPVPQPRLSLQSDRGGDER